jgi:hypothetical protein
MATQSYTWKPALLANPDTLTLDGPNARLDDAWTLDLGTVEDAAFVNQTVKGNRMVRLDLYTAEGRRSLGYNGAISGYAANPEAQAHLAACAATLRALARAKPELQIALGVIRGGRWGMFVVGLGTLTMALVLTVAMLVSGVSGDRLAIAAIPMVFLFAMGVILIYGNWPWRKRPRVQFTALAKTLEDMQATETPPA